VQAGLRKTSEQHRCQQQQQHQTLLQNTTIHNNFQEFHMVRRNQSCLCCTTQLATASEHSSAPNTFFRTQQYTVRTVSHWQHNKCTNMPENQVTCCQAAATTAPSCTASTHIHAERKQFLQSAALYTEVQQGHVINDAAGGTNLG
jgi:hypothetical protein